MSIPNLNDLTLEEIEVEIERRQQLIGMMVGTLYPAVVLDELCALRGRKAEIERILKNEGIK